MLQPTHDNFFLWHNYAIITLYILDWPSSWSILRICPSWPQSRVRLRLLLLSSISILLVCFGLPSILIFTPTSHVSRSNPPLPGGQLYTNEQVNNIATLHHIYTVTYIYITFILLFIPFFILLPICWAGRLVQTLLVCHSYEHYYYLKLLKCNYYQILCQLFVFLIKIKNARVFFTFWPTLSNESVCAHIPSGGTQSRDFAAMKLNLFYREGWCV